MTLHHADDAGTVPDRGPWTYADDPELVTAPWATWDRLREESRAFVASEAAEHWDVWTLMRYDDVHEALRTPELFSSRSVLHVYEGPKLIDPAEADAVRGHDPGGARSAGAHEVPAAPHAAVRAAGRSTRSNR